MDAKHADKIRFGPTCVSRVFATAMRQDAPASN